VTAGDLAVDRTERTPRATSTAWLALGALALAVGAAPLVVLSPSLAVAGVSALALVAAIWAYPQLGAYLLVAVTPLVAGIDRGSVLPALRPNEALGLLVAVALLARGFTRLAAGAPMRIRFNRIDGSILLLAVLSSIFPLLWMIGRGRAVTADDILHALELWKYYAIFVMVRSSVRTEQQVRTCLWLSMGAGSIVALVAILQSMNLFGVPGLLATWYAPAGEARVLDNSRGTSTLSQSFAVADLMIFNLAIALGFLARGDRRRWLLFGLAGIFLVGTIASGQISGFIGLLIGLGAVGFVTGQLKRVLGLICALPVAGLALWPVIERRLSGFDSPGLLPQSWSARLDNLRTFFWPEIFSDWNLVLGVRAAARVPSPEWRRALGIPGDYVFIESGHTWLLWTGGIPLLIAFFVFLWTTMSAVGRVARERMDAIGVAAVASYTSLAVVAVLMTLDTHLNLRGSADLLFSLLALACVGLGASTAGKRGDGRASS
jgi:hypothetical protein